MHVNVGLLVLYYIIWGKNKRSKYFLGRTMTCHFFMICVDAISLHTHINNHGKEWLKYLPRNLQINDKLQKLLYHLNIHRYIYKHNKINSCRIWNESVSYVCRSLQCLFYNRMTCVLFLEILVRTLLIRCASGSHCLYFNRTFGPVIGIFLPDQSNFYRTFAYVRRTFGMTVILQLLGEQGSYLSI